MSTVQTEITQLDAGIKGLSASVDALGKKLDATSKRPLLPRKAQQELNQMMQGIGGLGTAVDQLNRQLANLNLSDTLSKQFDGFSQRIVAAIGNGFKNATQTVKNEGSGLASELEKTGKNAGESINKGVKSGLEKSSSLVRQQIKQQQAEYEALLAQGGTIKAGALQSLRTAGVSLTPLDRGRLAAVKAAAKLETDVTKAAADFEKALRADLNKFINQTANEQIKQSKSNASERLALISQIGQAESAIYKQAFASEKAQTANSLAAQKAASQERLSLIKQIGQTETSVFKQGVDFQKALRADLNKFVNQTADAQIAATKAEAANAKAQTANALAAQKAATTERLGLIKQIGQTESFIFKQAVDGEKTAAAERLAAIKAVGAASKRMLDQKKAEGAAEATFEKQLRADLNKFINQTADAQIAANKRVKEANEKALQDDLAGYRQMLKLKVAAANAAASQIAKSNSAIPNLANYQQAGIPRVQRVQGEGGEFSAYNAKEVARRFKEAGDGAKEAASHVRLFTGDSRDALSAVRGLANGLGQALPIFGSLGPILIGTGIGALTRSLVELGLAVDDTFSRFEALGRSSGVGFAEQAEQINALREQMGELARTGPIGPLDIAKAMKTLTLAGLEAQEVSDGLRAVLNFAVAGDTSLEKAADVMVSVATAFKFSANEYNVVADTITKTAAVSKASVESVGEAFKTASVLSAQYGVSLQDVGLGLAALSNLGIQGTAAGVALRNMFVDLSGRTKETKALLKTFGIELRDELTGGFNDLIGVVEKLQGALQGLSAIEQADFKQKLLSERGAKPLIELLELIEQKAKSTGDTFTNELHRMRFEIENAAGFAAIATAQIESNTLNTLKGVKASFQQALVDAFRAIEPVIFDIALKLREAFNSPEFVEGLKAIGIAVASVTEFLIDHGKTIMTVVGAYLALKAASSVFALVSGAASAVANLSLAAANAATNIAKIGLAQSALNAILPSAAATTGALAGVAAGGAGAASKIALLGGGLVRLLGFLTPVTAAVSLGVTAYQLYDLFSGKAAESTDKFSGSWGEEYIRKLDLQREAIEKNIRALEGKISLEELARREDAKNARTKATGGIDAQIAEAQKELERVSRLQQGNIGRGSIKAVQDAARAKVLALTQERDAILNNIAAKEFEVQASAGIEARIIETRRKSDEKAKADRLRREQDSAKSALLSLEIEKDKNKKSEETFRDYYANIAQVELDAFRKRNQTLQQEYKQEQDFLKAALDAKLITEGEYYAESLVNTERNEQSRRDAIKKLTEDGLKDFEAKYAELFRDQSKNANFSADLERVNNQYKLFATQIEEATTQLDQEAASRQKLASINIAARIKKEELAYKELNRELDVYVQKLEEKSAADLRSAGLSEAEIARNEARANTLNAFADKISKTIEEQNKLQESAEALSEKLDQAYQAGDVARIVKLEAEFNALKLSVDQGSEALDAFKKRLNEVADAAGDKALTAKLIQDFNELNGKIKDGIVDAIIEGATNGGDGFKKSLQKSFKDFAKQKLRLVIDAIINPISSTIAGFINPGAAQAANSSGGLAGAAINTAISQGLKSALGSVTIAGSSIAAIGSSVVTGIQAGFTGANLSGAIAAYSAAGQTGVAAGLSAGSSIGSAAAAAGPYVLAAVAALNALGVFRSRKIVDGGIQGELGGQVNDFALERKGGTLFSGPSYRVLDRGVSAQNDELQRAYDAMRTTVAGMADQLGIGNDAIKAFTVQLGNDLIHPDTGGFGIKTQGLSQDEIVKKIEAALVSANEQLAAFALGTTEFTREGETASQTLARLAGSLQTVNGTFDLLGLTLADASLAGADAASKFLDSFGGAEQFAQVAGSYLQNFYTEAERTAIQTDQLKEQFVALGLQMPTTREGFRALVEQQRELGASALPTVAALFQLQGAFSELVPAIDEAAKTANDAIEALRAQAAEQEALRAATTLRQIEIQKEIDTQRVESYNNAVNKAIVAQSEFTNALRVFRDDILKEVTSGQSALLSPEAQYQADMAAFKQASATALRSGNPEDAAALKELSQEFLKSSQEYFAGSQGYFKDLELVRNSAESLFTTSNEKLVAQLDAKRQAEREQTALRDLAGRLTPDQVQAVIGPNLAGAIGPSLTPQGYDSQAAALAAAQALQTTANNARRLGVTVDALVGLNLPQLEVVLENLMRGNTLASMASENLADASSGLKFGTNFGGTSSLSIQESLLLQNQGRINQAESNQLYSKVESVFTPTTRPVVTQRNSSIEVKQLESIMINMGQMMQAMQSRLIELNEKANEQRDEQLSINRREANEAVR